MADYRLSLTQTGGALSALWTFDGAATTPLPITPTLTAEDLAEHRWYLEEYILFPGPGDHARAQKFERRLEAFGKDLRRALFHDGLDQLQRLVDQPGPRLFTLTSKDPAALSLPWELLRDDKSALVFQDVILRRALPVTMAAKAAPIPSLPLRILLVIARPSDAGQIDARSSAAPMMDALDGLGGLVHVELCEPPTLAELERRLGDARDRGERFHVVHFDGHGVYLPDLGVGALCFEKDDATKHLVPGSTFGDLLARMEVPLAFLEACQTADLSGAPVFGSVAPALLKAGVGSVIAFSHALLVSAARILVARFYQVLCKGKSVGQALNEGRSALVANPVRIKSRSGDLELRDWHIAQLYQGGADPVLVPAGARVVAEGTEPLQRGKEPGSEFAVEPMYGFHGRAAELLKLQRRLRAHGAVVLQGGGGMGKTSLAREAARWWHRMGLRPGGAAFFSFESRQGVDRAVLGFVQYVEGDKFQQGSPEELWKRAVRYFRERDVLWVWDNFESTLAQYQKGHDEGSTVFAEEERDRLRRLYEELTRKGGKGWLVVTCRPDNTGLPGIAEMTLGGLTRADALDMARRVLDKKDVKIGDVGYGREAIEDLLEAVGHHPLSIELVMAHCKVVKPTEAAKDLRKVVEATSQASGEDRNTSLVASLKWSTGRLSVETQRVLPYLAWFDGGAFEIMLEAFSDVGPEVWGRVRAELLSTALIRVEDGTLLMNKPYLGFHPTLPYGASPDEVADKAEVGKRFVGVYYELRGLVDKAHQGAKPADAMKLMLREEGNFRRAMGRAFEQEEYEVGAALAETIRMYLSRAGRVRDQARLAAWVQEHMTGASGPTKWATDRQHAWGLFLAGNGQAAVDLLMRQLGEIEEAGGEAWQRTLCLLYLGRIRYSAGQPQHALGPLVEAIEAFEAAGDRGNLAAALGDQANALQALGKLAEALTSAEKYVEISQERGDAGNEAKGLGIMAQILVNQHRYGEAEKRYEEALAVARLAGDGGLEGAALQHLGILAHRQGQHALAVTRCKEALVRLQVAEYRAGEMMTADLLGTAEEDLGHYESARAWYTEAERLARDLGDERQLGTVAQNVGILLQTQALALPDDAKAERLRLLGEAATSLATSLALRQKRGDEVGAAASLAQLGSLHRLLGNLDEAERHAQQALAIRERLDLPDVYKDYWNLEDLATARHRPQEAATWRAKKEAKIAELQRLARGDGPPRLPPQARQAFLSLAQTLYALRTAQQPLPLDLANTLTQLAAAPPPLAAAGRFLQSIAEGHLPDPPPDLPPELEDIFTELVKSLRAASS
jgi:tetratricopeptide (TPR) repeat protein